MPHLIYITHPDVVQDPAIPVPQWPLSARGRERMSLMLGQPWVPTLTAVYSSTEQKSLDGAAILAGHLNLEPTAVAELGEIDRSSTGFLPNDEHAALSRACFEQPEVSARGWETAVHAQRRVAKAAGQILQRHAATEVVAVIGHGGVGTLLLCHLMGRPIGLDQRPGGADGGYYFVFDTTRSELMTGWQRIEELSP